MTGKIKEIEIYEVLFVDDWLMMALNMHQLTVMMEIAVNIITVYGLSVSWPKTQMVIVGKKKVQQNEELIVCGHRIEEVEIFRNMKMIKQI